MSGTSKFVVSICVLLLAALVVYYGITPPETSTTSQLTDIPVQRPSMFGGNPEEKLIALGFPPPAADLADPIAGTVPFVTTTTTSTDARPSTVVVEIEPATTDIIALPEKIEIVQKTYRFYEVKEGETLGEIAQNELGSFRMWSEIVSMNNIIDPSRIHPGNMLRLPIMVPSKPVAKPAVATPAKDGSKTYSVQEGDTMSSIAGEYYGDMNQYAIIAIANPSVNPNRLKIGMKLTIPKR